MLMRTKLSALLMATFLEFASSRGLRLARAWFALLAAITTAEGGAFSALPFASTNAVSPKAREEAEAALKRALQVEQVGTNLLRIGRVEFDPQQRTITLRARLRMRE